jgi:hypothetical protein
MMFGQAEHMHSELYRIDTATAPRLPIPDTDAQREWVLRLV